MKSITKKEYQKALELIKEYERRQNKMAALNKELGYNLLSFNTFDFEFLGDTTVFAGYVDGKVKIGVSKCNPQDKYDRNLGKIISVRKAMGQDIEDVLELVEGRPCDFNDEILLINDCFKNLNIKGVC